VTPIRVERASLAASGAGDVQYVGRSVTRHWSLPSVNGQLNTRLLECRYCTTYCRHNYRNASVHSPAIQGRAAKTHTSSS
jgi:hypothetical protein